MRPVFDPTGGPDVLVEKMIGTAYETVKRVYCHLPEIRRLDGVLTEIPILAQTSVDNALSVAMPPILAQLGEKVQAAEGWAGEAEASAEAAAQSAIEASKVSRMFPFFYNSNQLTYDVTVISGDPTVTTAGLALWVEGAIEYDFTILSGTLFRMNDISAYPDNAQMRIIVNARFDDLVQNFDQLQDSFEQTFEDFLSGSGMEVPVPYASGIVITRPTQTVSYEGRDYRVNLPYLPLTTTTWLSDSPKMVLISESTLRAELADPLNSLVAWKRRLPSAQPFKYVHQMLDVQAVQVWEYVHLITDKPNPADSTTWDWYPAIQAALDYAATLVDGWRVALPNQYVKCNSGLVIRFPKVSLEGSMCILDFSAMTSGFAMTFIRTETGRPQLTYGGAQVEMTLFAMLGPGRTSNVDAFRIGTTAPLSATTGQAPTFRSVYVQGFRDCIYGGSDAYLARFTDCEFYSNACVLHLPAGEANYGENFSFKGGSMHGNRRVITMEANNASVFMSQVSMDFNGKDAFSQFYIRNSSLNLVSCHIEMGHVNTPVTVPPIDISGDQARLSIEGGFILAHPNTGSDVRFTADYFALIGAGASVTIDGPRVPALQPKIALAQGAGRLIVRDWEIGNVSDVTGWGKDQVLMDYGFESDTIQDMIYIQNGIGTALDWRTGENLILSNSPLAAYSGSKSLRVQKKIGSSSSPTGRTAFTIAIRARQGERFHYRFKCMDRHARGGSIGVTMRWGNSLGSDKDGIPRSSQGAAFSIYSFTPSAAWGTFFPLNNVSGVDGAACPPNADTLFITVNMNSFVGGLDSPDGGWYSLFFDEFEIYRW